MLVANHRSWVDIPAILSCVECAFLAKHEMGGWPLFGALARRMHTVFVDRDSKPSRRHARRRLVDLLDEGLRVALFPEGTTSRGPGFLPFQPGMFHAAAERGVPVVPVAVHYDFEEDAWVGDDSLFGHFLDRFSRRSMAVYVTFGPALSGREGAALQCAAEDWIAAALARPRIGPETGEAAAASMGGGHGERFLPGRVPAPAGTLLSGRQA